MTPTPPHRDPQEPIDVHFGAHVSNMETTKKEGGPYILVVEDDRDVREVLSEVLAEEGYRVAVAANGLEGLQYLRAHPSARLILLDLMMPVMSGAEFRAQQLIDPLVSKIPVVILTAVDSGWENNADFKECDLIRKPLDLDTLLAKVKSVS
jgi:CheY-like chemotaxis protein